MDLWIPGTKKILLNPIHHINVLVADLDEALKFYWPDNPLGFKPMYILDAPKRGTRQVRIKMTDDTYIELMQPWTPDSPVWKLIEKKGPGISHLVIRVNNFDKVVQELKEKGIKFTDGGIFSEGNVIEEPLVGSQGARLLYLEHEHLGFKIAVVGFQCSDCKYEYLQGAKICPNCGKKLPFKPRKWVKYEGQRIKDIPFPIQ